MKKQEKPLWSVDFDFLPEDIIGATFNRDGTAWGWSVKPEIKGSEKRPNDLKWRGPVVGEGYICLGTIDASVDKSKWKDSWIER